MAKKRKPKSKDNRLIKSEKEAKDYASKFRLLDGVELVYVSEDGYLYYDHTAAVNFVKSKELFTVNFK